MCDCPLPRFCLELGIFNAIAAFSCPWDAPADGHAINVRAVALFSSSSSSSSPAKSDPLTHPQYITLFGKAIIRPTTYGSISPDQGGCRSLLQSLA